MPIVWRNSQNHLDDCYFCLIDFEGFNSKTKSSIVYHNLPSATWPIPHSDVMPVPVFAGLPDYGDEKNDDDDSSKSGNTEKILMTLASVLQCHRCLHNHN